MTKLLLKVGSDGNARDNWLYTPLHEAAAKGKVDVCICKAFYYLESRRGLACNEILFQCYCKTGPIRVHVTATEKRLRISLKRIRDQF